MATKLKQSSHKLGANQKETAHTPRKRDHNFSQSRDICEDRGARQAKTGRRVRVYSHLPGAR